MQHTVSFDRNPIQAFSLSLLLEIVSYANFRRLKVVCTVAAAKVKTFR